MGLVANQEIVEGHGAVERRPVVDLDEQAHVGQALAHPGHARAQRRVEDEHLRVAVVQEVREFVIEVSVVDVDRHGAMLEGPVLCDEVLRAVVQVQGDRGAFGDARRFDRRREARGAIIEGPITDPA